MKKWTKLTDGPHAGQTLPEVVLMAEDPDFVFEGLASGLFTGLLKDEAEELAFKMKRILLPEARRMESVVFYSLLPDGKFGGCHVVPVCEAALHEPFNVACTPGLDLSMAKKVAPQDPRAPRLSVWGLKFAFLGRPDAKLTAEQCATFFEAPKNFLA